MSGYEDEHSECESSSFRYIPVDLGDTEDLEKYKQGGFHPVHLGDVYDGHYRVVHKLGAGGFSTIWLARDDQVEKWVALKIVVAEQSATMEIKSFKARDATSLADQHHFYINGPNGRHICLILPVLGPSGSRISQNLECRMRPALARKFGYQATQALARLHAQCICHGDATTANIVFSLLALDRYSEADIYRIFGRPATAPVETESGDDPGPEAPRYIVQTLDFLSASENLIGEAVDLIDFDQSFPFEAPPTELLSTPVEFLAPEVCAGQAPGPASDVWAMGCSIFRLRSGEGTFSHFECWSPAIVMSFITESLGDPPDSWQPILFDEDGNPTKDPSGAETLGEVEPGVTIRAMVDKIYDEPDGGKLVTGAEWKIDEAPDEEKQNRFAPAFDQLVWKPTAVKIDNIHLYGYDDQTDALLEVMPTISNKKADLLFDLLSKIFVYEPEKRISTAEMLKHPWFHMDEADGKSPPFSKQVAIEVR